MNETDDTPAAAHRSLRCTLLNNAVRELEEKNGGEDASTSRVSTLVDN
jgi:hypothetical protein